MNSASICVYLRKSASRKGSSDYCLLESLGNKQLFFNGDITG